MSDPDGDIDEKWLADAKVGDFSTMPNPFTWDRSVKFAHIIDGYGVAGGVPACVAIADKAIDSVPGSIPCPTMVYALRRRGRRVVRSRPVSPQSAKIVDRTIGRLRNSTC